MPKLVRIFPTGTHIIPGVPAIEQEVSPSGRRALAYSPPPSARAQPGSRR